MISLHELARRTGNIADQYPIRVARSFQAHPRQAAAMSLVLATSLALAVDHAGTGQIIPALVDSAIFTGAKYWMLTNHLPEDANTH